MRGPTTRGRLITVSPMRAWPDSSQTTSSVTCAARPPVHKATPRSSSSSRISAPAASPKIHSGSRSGVTSVTVASATLRVSVAAMIASS